MTRRIAVLVLACAACLAGTVSARADARSDAELLLALFNDYVDDGRIDPCRYPEKTLRDLRKLVPPDINQYDAGFVPALDDALAQLARGACRSGGKKQGTTVVPPPATGTTPPPPPAPSPGTAPAAPAQAQPPPTPNPEPTPAPAVAARDAIGSVAQTTETQTDPPLALLALALLAGLLGLSGIVWGLVAWRAWEPAWAVRLRHAAGEAGWRASSTWSDFTDFVRFGR